MNTFVMFFSRTAKMLGRVTLLPSHPIPSHPILSYQGIDRKEFQAKCIENSHSYRLIEFNCRERYLIGSASTRIKMARGNQRELARQKNLKKQQEKGGRNDDGILIITW